MSNKTEYNSKGLNLVLECLKANQGEHLTAEDITASLLSEGQKIGKTTVYRNLEKLLSKGVITRYQGADSACYCFCSDHCCEQIHLICSECGKLSHLECTHVDELLSHIASEHRFKLDRHKTVLYGLCEECIK